MTYTDFLNRKAYNVPSCGFTYGRDKMNPRMFDWQKDERHICPLQLPVIGRCIDLWTNPGDVVLDPFSGIGSTGHQAILMGRRHIGIELKRSYYEQTVANLRAAEGGAPT